MPKTVKHAWTHRPRSEGGTDPIDIPASGSIWAKAFGNNNMTDAGSYYPCVFSELYYNDASAFEPADVTAGQADWIQINTPGYYVMKMSAQHASSTFPNTQDLHLEGSFELSGVLAAITQNMGVADFPGVRFTKSDQLLTGDFGPGGLYTEIAFNWNPGVTTSDLDNENPLKVGMIVSLSGGPASLPLIVNMFLQRISDAGYTNSGL